MRSCVAAMLCMSAASLAAAAEPPAWSMGYDSAIESVHSIGPDGKNGIIAARAAQHLATLPADALTWILRDFVDANPLAANLLRSHVETIVPRAVKRGDPLPTEWLLGTIKHPETFDGRARRLAYEILLRVDSEPVKSLLPGLLNDPNPELRRDAVAHWMAEARRFEEQGNAAAA